LPHDEAAKTIVDDNGAFAVEQDNGQKAVSKSKRKPLIIGSIAALSCALILAIVLPITLAGGRLDIPNNLRQVELNIVWDSVSGSSGYVIKVDGVEFVSDTNSFRPSLYNAGTHTINIRALHENERRHSNFSPDFNFIIPRRVLNPVVMGGVIVEKEYDGTVGLDAEIIKGIHYNFDTDSDVDINITSVVFNDPNVINAAHLIVSFDTILTGDDAHNYVIASGHFSIPARINPRRLGVIPQLVQKQFANDDDLSVDIYDSLLSVNIPAQYTRSQGESIGFYDLTGINSLNPNFYLFINQGAGIGRFEITRRRLTVVPLAEPINRVFDNTTIYSGNIIRDVHFEIAGLVGGFDTNIIITSATFNVSTIAATYAIIEFGKELSAHNDIYYVYGNGKFEISANITRREIDVFPNHFSRQYGDSDNLTQTILDDDTGISFNVTFIRVQGESVGLYDIIDYTTENNNFVLTIRNGANRFEITRRRVNVIGLNNATVSKAFDGTSNYSGDIIRGVHYEIEDIIDSYANIVILSQNFNFVNVGDGQLVVSFSATLTLDNDRFEIIAGSFTISATISPRQLDFAPPMIQRIYGDTDNLAVSHFDQLTNTLVSVVSITFNADGVLSASYATVVFTFDNPNYILAANSFILSAQVTQRVMQVTVPSFSRQFGEVDALTYVFYDNELNINVGAIFTRDAGNNVGLYNITSVTSQNPNFTLQMNLTDGVDRFEITARLIDVVPLISSITKTFDNTNVFTGDLILGTHYTIVNIVGFDSIDITILSAQFNSPHVAYATMLIVTFDAVLVGSTNYTLSATTFTIPAQVLPRVVEVAF